MIILIIDCAISYYRHQFYFENVNKNVCDMRHEVTWISTLREYGISTIIFDTCVRLSGTGSFARSRNIGSRERTTTTCPCRSREVQLIRSSLKVISQARNRNHRRDRAIDYTSPRAVMFPPMQVQRATAVHCRKAHRCTLASWRFRRKARFLGWG